MLLGELELRRVGDELEAMLPRCCVGVIYKLCCSFTEVLDGLGVTVLMLEVFGDTLTCLRFFPAIIVGGATFDGRKLWMLGWKTSIYETALRFLT